MKKIGFFLLLMILFCSGSSLGATYSDDFEDSTNDGNWSQLFDGTWECGPSSMDPNNRIYRGFANGTDPVAVSFVNSLPDLATTGISLYLVFGFGNTGSTKNTGLLFGFDPNDPSNTGYVAEIYENGDQMYLYIGEEGNGFGTTLSGVDSNTIFGLGIDIDSNNDVSWYLDTYVGSTPTRIHSGTNVRNLASTTGAVGVFTFEADGAEFGYFEVTGAESAPITSSRPWIPLLLLNE